MTARGAVVGLGSAFPPAVRRNDDPIFDDLRRHHPHHADLFTGYRDRRVLAPGDSVLDLAGRAAAAALDDAAVPATAVDAVLGLVSVGPYATPNGLAALQSSLGLRTDVWYLPLDDPFTTFASCLVVADALLAAGRIRVALIVCAADWSRHVDYRTPQSIGVGDGAGAAVVASGNGLTVVDHDTLWTGQAEAFGSMYLAAEPLGFEQPLEPVPPVRYTRPVFTITEEGAADFKDFGALGSLEAVRTLLKRHAVPLEDVTLACHQASDVLLRSWAEHLPGVQLATTLERYGNLTVATLPVNLAHAAADLRTGHVVLFGLAPEQRAQAVLLRRAGPSLR